MNSFKAWTKHLVVDVGAGFAARLPRDRIILVVMGIVVSGCIGLSWVARSATTRVKELELELAVLRAEQPQLTELASRLAMAERRFAALQAAVTATGSDAQTPPTVLGSAASSALPANSSSLNQDDATALAWPLAQRGFLTRNFGSRSGGSQEVHLGVDIAVPTGAYVRAIQAGRVEEAGEDAVYGRFVRIRHPDGLTSLYGHNSWLFAAVGDRVERLEVIALSGNTGISSAPHLHLQIEHNGLPVDPLPLIAEGNTARSGTNGAYSSTGSE